jgi:hypothetical protein
MPRGAAVRGWPRRAGRRARGSSAACGGCATSSAGRLCCPGSPNGHMSKSPPLVAGAFELSDKRVGPLMADHRYLLLRLEPSFEAAGSACWPMPVAFWARGALTRAGRAGLVRPAPGDPLTSPGQDLSSKIRVPVPPVPFPAWRATRPAGCWECAAGAGMGGRGLSHPQELPLISAGSRRALARTGACGQPGSRTANRMAVPQSPSIRERACPARLRSARTGEQASRKREERHGRILRHRLG